MMQGNNKISGFPQNLPKSLTFIFGLILCGLVGLLELSLERSLLISVVYLIPVIFVSRFAGRMAGAGISVIAIGIYSFVHTYVYTDAPDVIWNAVIHFGVFIAAALLTPLTTFPGKTGGTVKTYGSSLEGLDLMEERDKYKNFVENAIEIIYSTDNEGNINIANSAFFEVTGYIPEELSNLNYRQLVAPGYKRKISAFYMRQFLKKTPNTYIEFPIVTKSGEIKWVAQNAFITVEKGELKEFYCITRDISEQIETKDAIQDSERKLRQIIDLVPHFIFAKDKAGRFILANRAVAEIYSTTTDELLNKTDADFLEEKDLTDHFREDDLEVISSRESKFIPEEKIIDGEGNIRYLQTLKIPFFQHGADTPDVLGVSIDITERKVTEEALRESEKKFRNFAKTIPIALTRLDVKTNKYEFVNDEFIRQSGYTLQEFEKLSSGELLDMMYEEDRERVFQVYKKWTEERYTGVRHIDYRIVNKNKQLIWLDTYFYADVDSHGKPVYVNQICVDVTEQKETENILKRSEERYRAFITQSTEGIYRVEFHKPVDTSLPSGKIVGLIYDNAYIAECNNAFAKMYGYESSEEIIGKRLEELHGGKDVQENIKALTKFTEAGFKVEQGETLEVDKSGNKKYFYNNAVGIIEDGKMVRMWGSQSDITERRQIADQNRKLSQAIEQSSASIIIANTEGVIEYVNKKFTEITGYTPGEVMGKLARIFKKGTVIGFDKGNKELIDVINSGQEWSGEYQNRRKDKEEYWEYASISPIKDNHGRVTHFVAISEDITDQRLAEDSIRRSEERYRAFIAHSSEGIYRMELEKPIHISKSIDAHTSHFFQYAYLAECNDVMAKMYGFEKAEDVLHQKVVDIVGEKTNLLGESSTSLSFESFVKSGYRLNSSETREVDKQGNTSYFLNSGIGIVEDEYLVRIWGTQRDITMIKTIQEQVRKLSLAVEQSTDSIIITDTEGKIEYVNPKFIEATGFTFDEVKGMYPYILLKKNVPDEMYKKIWDTVQAGEDWKGEYYNKKKDGERYWEYATISPIKDDDGVITHYLYVKEDITERKKVESELLQAKEKAEEASNAKSQFLANMSHEIRTPMNGIVGMSQLLTLTELSEEQVEYVEMIHYSSDVLLKIINDILDFSKIESGKFKLNLDKFNIQEALESMHKILKNEAKNKNLALIVDVPGKLNYNVIGDRYRLNQILTNLISNAIKFTREGEIRLEAKELTRKDGKVKIEFIISDTGIGIPNDKFDNLFESFTQLENPYVKQYMGTGLGLSIVKRLIELMNGQIRVESKEDKGSVFTVTLDFQLEEV